MKKQLGSAAAKKPSSAATEAMVTRLSKRLAEAIAFVKANRDEILAAPVLELEKNAAVAAFCVLRRMGSAIDRRLKRLQPVIEAMFESMGPVGPGEAGHVIQAGAFAVELRNTRRNSLELDEGKVREILRSKRIPLSRVTVVPKPQDPFISEDLIKNLVAEGHISEAEFESMKRIAAPKLALHVDVPDALDEFIQNRLLGGIRDGG